MIRIVRYFVATVALAGCNSNPEIALKDADDFNRLEVFARCFEAMVPVFPAKAAGGKKLDLKEGVPRDEHIKLFRDGRFSIEIPEVGSIYPVLFGCTGNFKKRTIESLQLNGASAQSPNKKVWSY